MYLHACHACLYEAIVPVVSHLHPVVGPGQSRNGQTQPGGCFFDKIGMLLQRSTRHELSLIKGKLIIFRSGGKFDFFM